jgi:hypothetical protein
VEKKKKKKSASRRITNNTNLGPMDNMVIQMVNMVYNMVNIPQWLIWCFEMINMMLHIKIGYIVKTFGWLI